MTLLVENPQLVEKDSEIRCQGVSTRHGRAWKCNKLLMYVEPEHKASVLRRIEIACHYCGTKR